MFKKLVHSMREDNVEDPTKQSITPAQQHESASASPQATDFATSRTNHYIQRGFDLTILAADESTPLYRVSAPSYTSPRTVHDLRHASSSDFTAGRIATLEPESRGRGGHIKLASSDTELELQSHGFRRNRFEVVLPPARKRHLPYVFEVTDSRWGPSQVDCTSDQGVIVASFEIRKEGEICAIRWAGELTGGEAVERVKEEVMCVCIALLSAGRAHTSPNNLAAAPGVAAGGSMAF